MLGTRRGTNAQGLALTTLGHARADEHCKHVSPLDTGDLCASASAELSVGSRCEVKRCSWSN